MASMQNVMTSKGLLRKMNRTRAKQISMLVGNHPQTAKALGALVVRRRPKVKIAAYLKTLSMGRSRARKRTTPPQALTQ